jgi:wobble nucleotide-excising tRNase
MKIQTIAIKNFRGFYQAHPINLHDIGKNVILYGENGSGKTSLFLALKSFFHAAQNNRFIDHTERNLNAETNDNAYVKLTLNQNAYEWTANISPSDPIILEGYKFSGFLTYRDILATHYVELNNTANQESVNLFNLLVINLFADIENEFTDPKITFKQQWNQLQNLIPQDNRYKIAIQTLESELEKFNNGINDLLSQLTNHLRNIFAYFEFNQVELNFEPINLSYDRTSKAINGQEIILNVKFVNRQLQGKHPHYLNEAKLSAIGISLYLAALKLKPIQANSLALLVLDDILIGLDMSNRLPIIEIIEQHFIQNYQIMLMTYDLEWFEILCDHFVEPDKSHWKAFEFYCADDNELELPIFAERSKGYNEYLQRAETYFNDHDYKASAVYLRSAYEAILKKFCKTKPVRVPYQEKPKNLKADDIWTVVKAFKKRDNSNYVQAKTAKHIDNAISRVLNPLSHSRPVPTYRREIKHAIEAVKRLKQELGVS